MYRLIQHHVSYNFVKHLRIHIIWAVLLNEATRKLTYSGQRSDQTNPTQLLIQTKKLSNNYHVSAW